MPVGVPLYCGAAVAVNITDCPKADGFFDEPNVTVLVALPITSLSFGDVLAENTALPSYLAVMESVPTASVVAVKLAAPPDSVAEPSMMLPLLNVTLPLGVPADEDTVAVNTTGAPKLAEVGAAASAVVVLPSTVTDTPVEAMPLAITTNLPGPASTSAGTVKFADPDAPGAIDMVLKPEVRA